MDAALGVLSQDRLKAGGAIDEGTENERAIHRPNTERLVSDVSSGNTPHYKIGRKIKKLKVMDI